MSDTFLSAEGAAEAEGVLVNSVCIMMKVPDGNRVRVQPSREREG
ncbi:hypothetical protein LMCDFJHI_03885 [Aeromonas salmonicida]